MSMREAQTFDHCCLIPLFEHSLKALRIRWRQDSEPTGLAYPSHIIMNVLKKA